MKGNKSFFESAIFSTKIKSANAKLFPEGALGYFIGPTLALLSNSVLVGYFNRYMTDILDLAKWAAFFFNWLPVASVIFVVIGNIFVGRLMEKNKTRAGKARPLLLISLPFSLFALIVLFVLTPLVGTESDKGTQIFALCMIAVGYNLWFAIAYPFYYTSHSGLVNLSTRNSKDRSLLATISNATVLAAMGLTTMILPYFLNLLFVPLKDESGNTIIIDGVEQIDAAASYGHWKIFILALIAVTVIGVLIEFYFTRERITEESFGSESAKEEKIAFARQARACFADRYWWIVIVFFFLYQMGGMIKNVSQLYFCSAMFCDRNGIYSTAIGGSYHATLSIIGAIPTAIGMFLAWPLSNKMGKARAILLGAIISAAGGAIGFLDPDNFYVVCVSFVVKALGSTPAMYLSLALLADVLDHQEAIHGFRTDGLTMTVYGAIMAGMTGIATGILNVTLSSTGYSSTNISSEAIRSAMTWVFIGGETLCYVGIAVLFLFMNVEKFSALDHETIMLDKRAKANEAGVEFVDPAETMRREEEAAQAASEEARRAELKAKCMKKGLSFEAEEEKYRRALERRSAAAEKKKAAALERRKLREEKRARRLKDMSGQHAIARKEREKAKEEKRARRAFEVREEFNRIRVKNGKSAV